MLSLDKFNRKMSINGGSVRNENIRNSKQLLEEVFADDASFIPGVYLWELGKIKLDDYAEDEPIEVRIFDRKFSAAQGATAAFQTLFDSPLFVGDIVYNSREDLYMICTEVFNINDVHWQGKFTLCNWILRWQNKYGDILEYPCYDMNTTQYNSGEQSGKQFTIGSSQHMLTLPYDENTVALKTPQRFFMDKDPIAPASFIVTQNDTTSYNYGKKGLVKVTVTECANNNDTDRIDIGICDYIDKNDIIDNDVSGVLISKSVISFDTKIIKSGGDSQTFYAKFYDEHGSEVPNIVPRWNVICDFPDELVVEQADDYISLSIDNDAYIDEEFKLLLSDDRGRFLSSIIIEVESLL